MSTGGDGWPWRERAASATPDAVSITPGRPLRGRVRVPGDKSISHRALLLAARGEGTSVLRGLSDGDDVRRTAVAIARVGAGVVPDGADTVRVAGGLARLHEPEMPVDVGNSGTGMRLLAGWLAAFPWFAVLQGDAYLARRPMDRVVAPLRAMGATVDGRDGGRLPPLAIRGGGLHGTGSE